MRFSAGSKPALNRRLPRPPERNGLHDGGTVKKDQISLETGQLHSSSECCMLYWRNAQCCNNEIGQGGTLPVPVRKRSKGER